MWSSWRCRELDRVSGSIGRIAEMGALDDLTLVHFAKGCWDLNVLPAYGFSIKPLEVIHF